MNAKSEHNIFHHFVMVAFEEVENIAWLTVALAVLLGGLILYSVSRESFLRLAVGLPLVVGGISLFLFKIHEILRTLFNPGWLAKKCKFCRSDVSSGD